MITGFYAAKSGMKNFQASLDVTANNIANVNTDGYLAKTINFTDLLYTSAQGGDVMVGNGSKAQSTSAILSPGPMRQGETMNAMIVGDGYISVENEDGSVSYSRSGSFSLSTRGDHNFLTLTSGEYVLDQQGYRIATAPEDFREALDLVGLFSFTNPGALEAQGNGKFRANEASGQPSVDGSSRFIQGVVELSNVDLVIETTRMMLAQRGFQMNSRMLQTADELEQTVNTLRT